MSGAQEILDRLLAGRSREWTIHVPPDEPQASDDDPIVSAEEAKQRTARLFGWARNGPAIQAALSRVVEELADEGRVVRADGQLQVPSA